MGITNCDAHFFMITFIQRFNFYSVNLGLNNKNPILIPKFQLLTAEL